MTVYDSDLLGWWSAAACAGYDPEWWSDDMRGRAQAVQICATCPVRLRCLEDAWERRDIGIIRGGALFRRVRGLWHAVLWGRRRGPRRRLFTRATAPVASVE
jgi:hypothetical protein